jgi:hypothetical protein
LSRFNRRPFALPVIFPSYGSDEYCLHSQAQPPREFPLWPSHNSLQSYELSRLSHAANLRKEIGELLDEWLDENACAMLARWLTDLRLSRFI